MGQNVVSSLPTTFIGFDSAWTDNPKKYGAICAASFDGQSFAAFSEPKIVGFAGALDFIRKHHVDDRMTLVALDQPTIVPNATGMRPVERLAATLISWLGGGVQPSNTQKKGMFCSESPIWRFLSELGAIENPEQAREAMGGIHLVEVFPALALASLHEGFFGPGRGPRYNPARKKTFQEADFDRVRDVAARQADGFGLASMAGWLHDNLKQRPYTKEMQDKLDAVLCLLIGIRWRLCPRDASALLGNLTQGYMVSPITALSRARLESAIAAKGFDAGILR